MDLEEIKKEIEECKECKKNKYGLPVPGEGNPNADIMFLGMAPGIEESKTGRPFVGKAGKFLNKLLVSIGIKREEIFITSPVKYYPGKRAPTDEEIKHGMLHTWKQIEIIKPKLIVLLGNVAVEGILNRKLKVSEIHGKLLKKDGMLIFPTFHPSAAMRFPRIRKLMEEDMKKLKRILEKL
ncbi:MAG: uracil-DNA glycosylase [Candidatus Aenigmatarchaeota archaeon]